MESLPIYVVRWAVAAILATGQDWTGTFEPDRKMTLADCTAYVEQYKDRMPDYVRGHFEGDFDMAVIVRGQCKLADDGADATGRP